MIKDIQEGDHLWAAKDRRRERRRLKKEENAAAEQPEEVDEEITTETDTAQTSPSLDENKKPPSFY